MTGYLKLAGKNILRHRIRSGLTLLGIAASVGVLFAVLSFNQGFNKGLARGLVNDPSVLLADEPTGNLDTENFVSYQTLIRPRRSCQ